jgi:hypothetical protein
LAKKPDQRFASVREFKQALGASASPIEASVSADGADRTTGRIALAFDRMSWRNPLVVAATVVVAGLLIFGALALIPDSGPSPVTMNQRPKEAAPARAAVPLSEGVSRVVLPPPGHASSPPVVMQRQ